MTKAMGEEMTHPDDGLIQTFLDGEMDGPEEKNLRAHLDACTQCRDGVEAQAGVLAVASRALGLLDGTPEMEAAGPRVRARLEEARVRARPEEARVRARLEEAGAGQAASVQARASIPWYRNLTLPRAASIALLLTAAAATALPGSPVRRWLGEGWDNLRGTGAIETGVEGDSPDEVIPTQLAEGPLSETGATLPSGDEGVELWIQELGEGAQLRVLWVDEGQAGIFADQGTTYRRLDNRLEALAPPGSVRVEIPRSLSQAVVGVNGEVVLRVTEQGIQLVGPVLSRTDTEILFGPWNPSGEQPR